MLKKYIVTFLICLLLFTNTEFAQDKDNGKNIGQTFLSDVNHFFYTGGSLAAEPFKYSSNDWFTLAAVVGGTALLFTIDQNVQEFALKNQNSTKDKIFGIDKYYGSGYTALFTAGLYGVGLFTGETGIRKLGLHASEALIYSALITTVLKIIIGRRRPYAGDNNLVFKPFQFTNNDYQSLPSGHTTVVFAVSTVMADYIDNIFWKIFWYGSAGLVGAARIYHNKHWVSDVFLGGAIGYFVGRFVVNLNNKKDSGFSSLNISPTLSFDKVGLQMSFRF